MTQTSPIPFALPANACPDNVHRRLRGPLTAAALALLLAACGGGAVTSTPAPSKPVHRGGSRLPDVRQPSHVARDPKFQAIPGVEGVIGADRTQLVRLFGEPRLDVMEGDARKLQFTGTACLLDIYLYPPTGAKEPVATYVDARRGSDGKDVDRAACIAALRKP
ncbi:hypothetical protein EDF56_104156 [Novosphingobium sp. PhB165]|uniref:hypothetical protein n=1 Tax=Novosphingobium sp. PhB165 TaxID=2485105 RepID=UPI0010CE423A|nr:hypothetical protein [Novosphingobium sp. PhB165]TCM18626.1 hypothetical protein EDF56_104156 [Novosphingobium sp. PhB165]